MDALAESVYISSIEGKTVYLFASSDFQAETAREVATQIRNALQTAGLDIKRIRVTTHPEG